MESNKKKQMSLPIQLLIISALLLFVTCKKDNDYLSYKWETIDLQYGGELNDIAVINNDTILVLSYLDSTAQNTVIFTSCNSGKTWVKNSFPKIDEGGFRSFCCLNSSTLFASGVYGIYRSNNGGLDWRKINFNGREMGGGEIYFEDEHNGFVAKTNTIYSTVDGGSSFMKVYDTTAIMNFSHIQFFGNQLGYASGGAFFDDYNFGIIVKSTDGGNTWSPITKQFKDIIGISFISPKIGYVTISLYNSNIAGNGGSDGVELLRTLDGGSTWEIINKNIFADFNIRPKCYFIDVQHGFLYGSGKILSTSDSGRTWKVELIGNSSISPKKILTTTNSRIIYTICENRFLLRCTINP